MYSSDAYRREVIVSLPECAAEIFITLLEGPVGRDAEILSLSVGPLRFALCISPPRCKRHFQATAAPAVRSISVCIPACKCQITKVMAERVGFELGLFPTVLHKKEIAENPCKHCYLSTPPSFTCFSNFTPFNYFFDFLELMELMRRSGRFRHAAEFSPSAFQRTGTIPGNFPHPLDTVSMARPVSRFVSQLVLFIPSTISFFDRLLSWGEVKMWREPDTG